MTPILSPYDTVRYGPGRHLHPAHSSKPKHYVLVWKKDRKGDFIELPGLGIFNGPTHMHDFLEKKMATDYLFRKRYAGGHFMLLLISDTHFVDPGWAAAI